MENELDTQPSGDDGNAESTATPAAPGVVATVVVHGSSPDLGECLTSLAAQDYPNLQILILVTDSDDSDVARVSAVVEGSGVEAHVRSVSGNPGFGVAANSVLDLVQGDSGFFLFVHDDVALDPSAIRLLVEELYRSNAGIVGPKIVEWDDPSRLQMVGFDADRFGELDGAIEEHEIDQEQHDAVRDVFVVPSACLLVRADLFREMRGFEESFAFHGEDLDLCWRAHIMGARVVVVPAARVRHRGALDDRRDDLRHMSLICRHRLSTVAALTAATRSLVTVPLLVLVTLVESIFSLVTGHARRAATELFAVVTAPRDTVSILRRRRKVAALRRVPDREIAELQVRGSVRWRRMVRGRKVVGPTRTVSSRTRDTASIVTLWALFALLLIGSRRILAQGVQPVGDLLGWIDSPRDLWHGYLNGWWGKDLGASTAQPTGVALMAVASTFMLGHSALAQTVVIVGLVAMGWLGASRLCAVSSVPRARIIGTIAYAAVPLPYAAVAAGRVQTLVAYAVLPWALHFVRLFGGLGIPQGADESSRAVGDVIDHPNSSTRLRIVSKLSLLLAVTAAFAPSVLIAVVGCSILWLVASALAGGSMRAAGLGIASTLVAVTAAVVVNLPWMTRYFGADGWDAIVGSRTASGLDFWQLARFGIAPSALGGLVILLFVPALVAPFVSRGWRFVWAMRAGTLIIGSLLVAVVSQRSSTNLRLPEPGVLLAPAAVGLSLGVAMVWVVFGADVRGARFGLRQPVALLSMVCIPIGLVPALAVASDGGWQQPSATFSDQLGELLSSNDRGDFRVIVIGDERLVPGASHRLSDGIAYSIVDGGRLTVTDSWTPASDDVDRFVAPLLDAVASGSTDRVGSLMAPFGIRYVVIPVIDRVVSTSREPLELPVGLVDAFGSQRDFQRKFSPASMVVFENLQAIPLTAMLTPSGAEASTTGGANSLATSETEGATPLLDSTRSWIESSGSLPSGTLHVGFPFDDRWKIEVAGEPTPFGASFGSVMAANVVSGGEATLSYDSPSSRVVWVFVQFVLWSIVICGATQPRFLRRPRGKKLREPATTTGISPIIELGGDA